MSCPLCLSSEHKPLFLKNPKQAIDSYLLKMNIDQPAFFQCLNCSGVFKSPEHILPDQEEHLRYFSHENRLDDLKYLKYLEESIKPFLQHFETEQKGLDYGCGPTKGLEHILKLLGYSVESYDKFFFNSAPLLKPKFYDYLICHEVIEHLANFRLEFQKILDLLEPRGKLFIRTELLPHMVEDFENWYYKNDSTHVFFLSNKTFQYIEAEFKVSFQVIDKNKFLLRKLT